MPSDKQHRRWGKGEERRRKDRQKVDSEALKLTKAQAAAVNMGSLNRVCNDPDAVKGAVPAWLGIGFVK